MRRREFDFSDCVFTRWRSNLPPAEQRAAEADYNRMPLGILDFLGEPYRPTRWERFGYWLDDHELAIERTAVFLVGALAVWLFR
jgi:hypothetical protein